MRRNKIVILRRANQSAVNLESHDGPPHCLAMRRILKVLWIALQFLCVMGFAIFGAIFGAAVGFANHGLPGGIVTGCVGFFMGAFVGSQPGLFLQFWN
jgi:hypothetical protein